MTVGQAVCCMHIMISDEKLPDNLKKLSLKPISVNFPLQTIKFIKKKIEIEIENE